MMLNLYYVEYVTAMARTKSLEVLAENTATAIEKTVENTGVHFSMIRHIEDKGRATWSK